MGRAIGKACRGSEVTLRALWCKARSGGGRLQQATAREDIHIEVNVLIL